MKRNTYLESIRKSIPEDQKKVLRQKVEESVRSLIYRVEFEVETWDGDIIKANRIDFFERTFVVFYTKDNKQYSIHSTKCKILYFNGYEIWQSDLI